MGGFETESAAMGLIRDLIATNGNHYVAALAVGYEQPDGSFGATLSGQTRMARANELAFARA